MKGIGPTSDPPFAFHPSLLKTENRNSTYRQRMFPPTELESPKNSRNLRPPRGDVRSDREHFAPEDLKPAFQDIPSPISRNIDELVVNVYL